MNTDLASWLTACDYRAEDRVALVTRRPGQRVHQSLLTVRELFDLTMPTDADVWLGANVLAADATARTSDAVVRVLTLYADLDIKDDGLADEAAVGTVIDELSDILGGAQPAVTVATGHGFHPRWLLADGDDVRRARALTKAFGRLVQDVCERHGGATDGVYDAARILRVPGTFNVKAERLPVRIASRAEADEVDALSLDDVEAALVGAGVRLYPEDYDSDREPVLDRHDWPVGLASTCSYAASMVQSMLAERPAARHPWLVHAHIRLACARRVGCLNDASWAASRRLLADHFGVLLATTGERRTPATGEVAGAVRAGIQRAAEKTHDEVLAELDGHAHGPDPDDEEWLAGLASDPGVAAEDGSTSAAEDGRAPGDSWRPVDLTEALERVADPDYVKPGPTLGRIPFGDGLLYPGKVHDIHGVGGGGKSMLAVAVAAEQITDGADVVWVDLEDDVDTLAHRLVVDFGVPMGDVAEHLSYVHPSEPSPYGAKHLRDLVAEREPTLVVIDSTGEGLALDGAKPNDDDDVARWFRSLARPLAEAGPSVLLIDHVPKADAHSLMPVGSQRKQAAISGVTYSIRQTKPFADGVEGYADVVVGKDRQGFYPKEKRVARFEYDPVRKEGHRFAIAAPPMEGDDANRWKKDKADEVVEFLTKSPGTSGRQVTDTVKGRADGVRYVLALLVDAQVLTATDGPKRGTYYALTDDHSERLEAWKKAVDNPDADEVEDP